MIYKDASWSKVVIGILAWLALLVWYGVVLRALWEWFAAPVFNVPLLSLPQAVGIAILLSFILPDESGTNSTGEFMKDVGKGTMRGLTKGILVLAAGFLTSLFV